MRCARSRTWPAVDLKRALHSTGARGGFASLVTALLFVLCLFAAPLLVAVPASAVGAAPIVVGFLMLGALRHLPAEDGSRNLLPDKQLAGSPRNSQESG